MFQHTVAAFCCSFGLNSEKQQTESPKNRCDKIAGVRGARNGVIVSIKAIYFLFWHFSNIEAADDFCKENSLD